MRLQQVMWSIESLKKDGTGKTIECVLERTKNGAMQTFVDAFYGRRVSRKKLPGWARPVKVVVEWEGSR